MHEAAARSREVSGRSGRARANEKGIGIFKISIKPQWTIRQPDGQTLSPRLLELLGRVQDAGSLSAACAASGASYRHAWDMVRQGEAMFGAPLLQMERGKGSKLTALGEKLVWADHRIAARLSPVLDSLASELEVELERVVRADPALLRIHASHGFAIEKLFDWLDMRRVDVERKYVSSIEAVASLHDGGCDIAGFHMPIGEFEPRAFEHHARWFDLQQFRVIGFATRRQGLIVAAGNPKKIYEVADLARADVRFINRQRGSGTRFLLDSLLERAGVDALRLNGYQHGEYTHKAVAAYVASGMADAGFGIETPARHFKLDFIPVVNERYFLLCREESLARPQVRAAIAILRDGGFQTEVDQLPGYAATECGAVKTLGQMFPGLAPGGADDEGVSRRLT